MQLGALKSRAPLQTHTGALLMGNGQNPLGDLRELGLIPVSICRKLDICL